MHEKSSKAHRNMQIAFWMNLLFVGIELAGGWWTNSISILSDAVHDFGDCAAIFIAVLLERVSERQADNRYTYGYRRYSLLSALLTGLVLSVGSAVVIAAAIGRLCHPETGEVRAVGMIILSVVGVLMNGVAALTTSHGDNLNERGVSLHMLEDVLGWAVVLVGSICMSLFHCPWLDPVLSIGVTVFVLWEALQNIRQVFSALLEKVPDGFDVNEYRRQLSDIPDVRDVHHVHVWTLDGQSRLATLHVQMDGQADMATLRNIKQSVRDISYRFGIEHITVQTDTSEEACDDFVCRASESSTEHSSGHFHSHSHGS